MVVVFPEPFGPRKPCTSPRATLRSSPSRARTDPKVLTRPSTSIATSAAMACDARSARLPSASADVGAATWVSASFG